MIVSQLGNIVLHVQSRTSSVRWNLQKRRARDISLAFECTVSSAIATAAFVDVFIRR